MFLSNVSVFMFNQPFKEHCTQWKMQTLRYLLLCRLVSILLLLIISIK